MRSKLQKKAPEDIQGLLAGSSWLLHIKQICIKNQGKEAGIVLIGLIQEITCHQPLIRLDLYIVQLVCCDEFQAVVTPCIN
jgi:hypothetical protein